MVKASYTITQKAVGFFLFLFLLTPFVIHAQNINISGRVVSESDQQPLAGCSVSLQGAGTSTVTDANGQFSLIDNTTPNSDNTLTPNTYHSYMHGNILFIDIRTRNHPVTVELYTATGRRIASILKNESLEGQYRIDPLAALSYCPAHAILLLKVQIGQEVKNYKLINFKRKSTQAISKTTHNSSSIDAPTRGYQDKDTLVIALTGYITKKMGIANYITYLGDIQLKPDALPTYTLTVNASPSGSGSVTKNPNLPQYTQGTQVTLTANANATYSFKKWLGDATGSTQTVTVTMDANKAVTAQFMAIPSLTGTSNTNGVVSLTWTYVWSGLGSTSDHYEVEESTTSPTTGFTKIHTTPGGDHTSPYTYQFNKGPGTYYYRVRAVAIGEESSYSNVVTISMTQVATLRIVNNTHYDMIDIRLNNQQMVDVGYCLQVKKYADFTFTSAGTVNYILGVGFWNDDIREVWFFLQGTATVTMGQVTTITFNNPTIGQLLSNFSASRNWVGDYYVDLVPGWARFNFTQSGTWTLYDNDVQVGSGNVTLVSWPDYAMSVSFKVEPTGDVIYLNFPFGQFYYNNGPPQWQTILYVAQ